jgi:predicted Rossmann-fold nucleotide-binding protein
MARIEIGTSKEFVDYLVSGEPLSHIAVQDLDLRSYTDDLLRHNLHGAVFLGCRFQTRALEHAIEGGALVFPRIPDLPYDPYRSQLYTPQALLGDYRPGVEGGYANTLDGKVWAHYRATGSDNAKGILETLSRRLHDHAITDAMQEYIAGKMLVGVMGGHSLLRTDPRYRDIVQIGRELSREGFLMVTGGGPGAMEAAHVGAHFAYREDAELDDAITIIGRAPLYDPIPAWMDAAWEAWKKYPFVSGPDGRGESLGVPTWLYGHEPPTLFASHIAKYFANSIREDGLVTIAEGGLVFSPGSAGTMQEIFQDTTQNYYNTLGVISPMIFLDKVYWTETIPVYPLLEKMAEGREFARYLAISDDPTEIVDKLKAFAAERG